jgi:hypothetical protein
MGKRRSGIPPALRHGIYSGIGLLPTESRAKFRKFRKQIFAELNLVGRLEEDIGEQIVSSGSTFPRYIKFESSGEKSTARRS